MTVFKLLGDNRPINLFKNILLILLMMFFFGCGGGDGGSGSTANKAPEAEISVSAESGSAPLAVEFDAAGSEDSDGSISSYEWDFGDNSTGTGSSVSHTYQTSGVYTAQLTVTDDDGSKDTASVEITVEPSSPVAAFTVSEVSGTAPFTVQFDASGSGDADGTISSYSWNFGDGSTGSGTSASHTYSSSGTYTVRLTVTDNDDLTDSESRQITVYANPASLKYSISGTVTSAENMIVDSDVNDLKADYASNDSFSLAQEISAPVTVSGFVNVDNSGSRGDRFERNGDYDDYYEVSLTDGMNISLYMAEDSSTSELSLYLYSSDRTLVSGGSASTDSSGIASLTVSGSGTYYIRVEALEYGMIKTCTLYSLTIGLTAAAGAEQPLRLGDNFVPGEVLVRFDKNLSGTVSTSTSEAAAVSNLGLSTKAGKKSRDKLLKNPQGASKDAFFKKLGVLSAVERSMSPGKMDTATKDKMETMWMVRALRNQSGVACAELNYIRKNLQTPTDRYYSYQWHYPLINLPDAWDITTGSSDVIVAVVDTGVLLDHPDLDGQLVDGYDFISDTDISLDGDGIDDDPDDPGDCENVDGTSSFHGTHVAGTIAAATNNGTGAAGIAWKSKIMPLRALGSGGGTTYDIMEAVKYAAGLENDSGTLPASPADIINLSLGGEGATVYEQQIYAEVRELGIIVVAAAGNDGATTKSYPAAYDDVLSVSAVTIDEDLASYSNYGSTIDLAAPGGSSTDSNGDGYTDGVLSTCGDDSSGNIEMSYAFAIGTSMAAPHVSGVIALMKALYPALTPDEFDSLLAGGYLTRDLGDSGRDDSFGYGMIDAYKAVLTAQESGNSGGIPAILTASPSILNFGSSLSTADVVLENGGEDSAVLTVTGYSSSESWLSVTPDTDVDEQGLGTYIVTVSRDSLSDGTYSGTLTFESNENETTVSVVMRAGTSTASTDGGYHYVLLLDPDTYETIDQSESSGDEGKYEYSFSGLSYGDSYIIYAGTDSNSNSYICDDGEACGAYLSLDKPVEITINSDLTDVDFSTDINMNLHDTATSLFARDSMQLQLKVK